MQEKLLKCIEAKSQLCNGLASMLYCNSKLLECIVPHALLKCIRDHIEVHHCFHVDKINVHT